MHTTRKYILFFCIAFMAVMLQVNAAEISVDDNFTVVIDAGHGGNDPGAIGKLTKEKNINLNVALKLGKLIEQNCQGTKVVYTRKTDKFIALDKRSQIANNAKADLFISIHTNSLAKNHSAQGASTWTLGLAKSTENLDVAKQENSVILYEDDYKTRYSGFDPNSSESYIIFEFMQDKYMSQSVDFASYIQKEFRNYGKRRDSGVHQAGFLVLKASAMPSVLVELGFISTPAEEKYLSSENGASTMANSIYRAFLKYRNGKTNIDKQTEVEPIVTKDSVVKDNASESIEEADEGKAKAVETVKPSVNKRQVAATTSKTRTTNNSSNSTRQSVAVKKAESSQEIVFKVQFYTYPRLLNNGSKQFKGLSPVEHYVENNTYKYTYGSSRSYDEIKRERKKVSLKFKDAFIVAFKNGKRISLSDALKK